VQYADSPASLNPSFHCSFFLIILSKNISSTLFVFHWMFAGIISSSSSNSSVKFTNDKEISWKSSESKSFVLVFSSYSWNLSARSSIFFVNSSTEKGSKLALQALLKPPLRVKSTWCSNYLVLQRREVVKKRLERFTKQHTRACVLDNEGEEIAEARVWEEEEEGEWGRTCCGPLRTSLSFSW